MKAKEDAPAKASDADTIRHDDGAVARRARVMEAYLSSIPDYVYAFDRERRFAYANPAMLALFGLSAEQMLGKTFADLDYPPELATLLNSQVDRIFEQGVQIDNEVFYQSPTGYAACFAYLWGPVRGEDGAVELVIGVSRDTSERRAFEETLRASEARLRAATELVGLGIYSWDPSTNRLDWDDRLRELWGLPPDAPVDMATYESGIHPADLDRVRAAIAACVDPAGDGHYNVEYRVTGRDDGLTRHIATSGRTIFEEDKPLGFIGAAIDVTSQRTAESAIRASEAQFQSFAANSSNLLWIGDPEANTIIYRSKAFERIWGIACDEGATDLSEWIKDVHPDDRTQVEHALDSVRAGEVVQFEYRILRPTDGRVRKLRDTSFPIPDDHGAITRIGGITEELAEEDVSQVYILCNRPAESRHLGNIVRGLGYRARIFESAARFLDIAAVLAPGCVLLDLRRAKSEGLSLLRELRARNIGLPTIGLNSAGAGADVAVATMKAGAVDYVIAQDDALLSKALQEAIAECKGATRPSSRDESATAHIASLTSREREVLEGLIQGGTNKSIARQLGISPRTVELHRSQLMHRLNASSLTQLLQIGLAAGLTPSGDQTGSRASMQP